MENRGSRSDMKGTRRFCRALLVFIAASVTAAKGETWSSVATGHVLELTRLEPTGTRAGPVPVVFYLKNLAAERVGAESDDVLIRELRALDYLVVILDYAGHEAARVPWINRDLGKLRDDVRAKKILADRAIDAAHVFIVPAGSRLMRDVVFYRAGGRTLAMDIIAPAKPRRPVGTVPEFSCDNQDRMGNTSLSICSDTLLDAEATEGFAVAMADHPVAAPYKGLDAMLVTTEGISEFEGQGEHVAGGVSSAVQGGVILSGRFTYLDLLAGDHMLPRYTQAWGERAASLDVWRRQGALDYLATAPAAPLFLSINCSEAPDALHQMTVLRRRLAELGGDEVFLMDREPRGHKVPLDPVILGAMNDYLQRQLSPAPNPRSP
jgi:hypothetical protein